MAASSSSSPARSAELRARLETIIALARLLERLENQPGSASPSQYQQLVARLKALLQEDGLPQQALDAVLAAHPATAELYENLHYEHSGLCRSPLELSVAAETQVASMLSRLAKRH
ncbi:hypothetical protein MW290_20635 [Aquincola tertiaricarbonis]|uniref:Uncharacterized protein n=1 Tax=Aquincola tertiaricarbonis TaxID=391953 RepID=A0ABY4SGV6_AQUTE|nr:hypothetical protein [Aquincola tertiaricarbonis]URI11357.1 hypothetical protein MW290_20635 [Aquincola tertiaricarbonis]